MNVTRADRHRLEAIVLDRSAPQKHAWRANITLATADGRGDKRRSQTLHLDRRPRQRVLAAVKRGKQTLEYSPLSHDC